MWLAGICVVHLVAVVCWTDTAMAAPFGGGNYSVKDLSVGDESGNPETDNMNSRQPSYWAEDYVTMGGKLELCEISTEENLHDFIDLAEDEENVNLFKFKMNLKNYTKNPLYNSTGLYFKPWQWFTTRSTHGRTLLMLSFHYDVLSMNILTIGVKTIDVEIRDKPVGCFGLLDTGQQVKYIRMLLLSRNTGGQGTLYGNSAREEFACNQEILKTNGDGRFVYNCCFKDASGKLVCSTKGDDFWINILYFAITSVKILMFLFCPRFLPNNVYSAAYVASEYVIQLKDKLKMKIFISEQMDSNVRFKARMTLEEAARWPNFRLLIDEFPKEEMVPIEMTELRIKVKGKRIIPENDPPTGLLRTIYDNLIRCKIKNLDPFNDCCETSIYANMEPAFKRNITWHKFVQMFVKCLMLLLVPFPYYIRLFIYFKFEQQEITERRAALDKNDLGESFNFYRTNVIQFFTPSHGIFISIYVLYFLSGLFMALAGETLRDKLKDVARSALTDQNAVSQTGVLGIIIRVLLYPFKRCGLLGFLIGPIYLVLIIPLCAIVFILYCIPTVYLSIRLPYHARKLLGTSKRMEEIDKEKKRKRLAKLGKKFSKMDKFARRKFSTMDKFAHHADVSKVDGSCFSDELGDCEVMKNIGIQVLCSIFCLCILYSIALVFAESTGLFVEVMAFTMMGIIVNAGSVLKYVSMVLLVFVYMNDCYSNVYENYLTFNKTIIDDIIDRTTADLRKIASMPSSQQANTAFQVKCVDEEAATVPVLNFEKKEIRWKLGQLLLFLDCYDTPRIPLRLFQKLCQVRVHGAPGPVYINLLAATGKFMIIVVFLMFVMIVVMAFGNVYQMSSTNTTLATLAGGFVPMLLKNVLSSKGARLSLKTVSFKGQIDEIIGEYKQYWPVMDIVARRYFPEEENEEEGEDGKENGEGDNSKDGKSDGKEKGAANGGGDKKSEEKNKDKKEKEAAASSATLKPPEKDAGKDKNGAAKPEEDKKNGGIAPLGPVVRKLSMTPVVEEEVADIYIDLSIADVAGWSINGSTESLPSTSMMPGYFDPNRIVIEEDDMMPAPLYHDLDRPSPPMYTREPHHVAFYKDKPL